MHFLMRGLSMLVFASTIILFVVWIFRYIQFVKKQKHFPKKLLIAIATSATLFLGLHIYSNYLYTFDFNTEKLPIGIGPLLSPTEQYSAISYYEAYGGAAGGVNILVEIIDHNRGDVRKIVYFSDAKSRFSIEWMSDDILYIKNLETSSPFINRSIELKVNKEIYDERGLACKSWLMKDEYENCYQR